MTYVQSKGKNKKLFRKNLLDVMSKSYNINKDDSLIEYNKYDHMKKNAVVCYTNKKPQIEEDYKTHQNSDIQLRYITSIPKILSLMRPNSQVIYLRRLGHLLNIMMVMVGMVL